MKKQLLALLFILSAVFNISADVIYERVTSMDGIDSNSEYVFVSEDPLTKGGVSSIFYVSAFAGNNTTRTATATALEGVTAPKDVFTAKELSTVSLIKFEQISGTSFYSIYSVEKVYTSVLRAKKH